MSTNIFPRLTKLALLYMDLLCRLVWLTDFPKTQPFKRDIATKDAKYIKNKFYVLL